MGHWKNVKITKFETVVVSNWKAWILSINRRFLYFNFKLSSLLNAATVKKI
jgi:hypothetical protein